MPRSTRSRLLRVVAGLCTFLTAAVGLAQTGNEAPPAFKASSLLAPALLKGPHHEVAAEVQTDGFFHTFTLTSQFGTFNALGISQVPVVIQEIEALSSLKDVSKTAVFLESAGRSVVNVGEGVVAAVKDPEATAKGMGAGFKRFGVNIGRRTQRAVSSATDESDETEDEASKDNAAEGAAKSVLGVNRAMRRWAQKVGVDPYTTNKTLRDALDGIAQVDAAGSIATKVVLPIPQVVGMTASVGDIVWGKDPEEVRKLNEQGLRDIRVPDDVAKALFTNSVYTLTMQTRFVMALRGVKANGRDDYVKTASEAKRWREALFYVESAEMLAQFHEKEHVGGLLNDSRALVAATAGGHAIALLPLDWIGDTAETRTALQDITARARTELKATRLTMVLTGKTAAGVTQQLTASGWTVARPTAAAKSE